MDFSALLFVFKKIRFTVSARFRLDDPFGTENLMANLT